MKGWDMPFEKKEAVTVWVALGALVSAALYQAVPDIDNELVSALVDLIVIAGPVMAAAYRARSQVWSQATLRKDGFLDG